MARIVVVPATLAHAREMALVGLREADRIEVLRAHGHSGEKALHNSLRRSRYALTALVDGAPVAMFGVVPSGLISTAGVIWLLATDESEKHWMRFGKISRDAVEFFRTQFSVIENFVDAENTTSINWLRWLGFTLDPEPRPFGVAQTPFYHFEWRKDYV